MRFSYFYPNSFPCSPTITCSLLLWSFTYDDVRAYLGRPASHPLSTPYPLFEALWLKHRPPLALMCNSKIPTYFSSEILSRSWLVPYSLTHPCSLMFTPQAGLTEDASAQMESALSQKLRTQMVFVFTGRRESPDYMQWVKGSNKFGT